MSARNPARTDLDTQVATIKTRLVAATRTRMRAEAERDAAQAAADAARASLARDFGVTSVEQAQAMLTDLDTALHAEVHAITAALDEMGL